ncbi:MAG TPA: acylphosphatase [Devosiaceae bacterium]|nr:acylphosphatase [Devosiaceae bacterium]
MKSIRVVISGQVQGVGFRAWLEDEANARSLAGWVRNRLDGTVEAVFAGPDGTVDAIIEAMRDGPPAAVVSSIDVYPHGANGADGFRVMPTA